MITIEGIQSQDAQAVWPLVQKWVAGACSHSYGTLTSDSVLNQVVSQDQQLWVIRLDGKPIAAMTTRVDIKPSGKRVLEVVTIGGSRMESWLSNAAALLIEFGRAHGCEGLEAHGRRGWVRALKQLGWRERSVTVTLEIENGIR